MMLSKSMNYNETRDKYLEHRKNMAIAERDEMHGSIIQITPIDPLKLKPTKITAQNKSSDIVMTPKREKMLFARDYFMEFNQITVKGLVREYEGIKDPRITPDKQLIRDFEEIINAFIDIGKIRRNGSYNRTPRYSRIINPDKVEALRNE